MGISAIFVSSVVLVLEFQLAFSAPNLHPAPKPSASLDTITPTVTAAPTSDTLIISPTTMLTSLENTTNNTNDEILYGNGSALEVSIKSSARTILEPNVNKTTTPDDLQTTTPFEDPRAEAPTDPAESQADYPFSPKISPPQKIHDLVEVSEKEEASLRTAETRTQENRTHALDGETRAIIRDAANPVLLHTDNTDKLGGEAVKTVGQRSKTEKTITTTTKTSYIKNTDSTDNPNTETTTITAESGETIEPDLDPSTIAPVTTKSILVDGRVPTVPWLLVKCHCGAGEVLTKDGCQQYTQESYIYGEDQHHRVVQVPVSSFDNVVVHEPECEHGDGHREMNNLTMDQFYVRKRGDVVLKDDDDLSDMFGLRINNYCLTHYLDENGYDTWTMKKACIPPPSVPRCCPAGEAMVGGECQPAPSPQLLTPPMSADIFRDGVPWPVIKNHVYKINCTKDPLRSIPLRRTMSYLLNVPTGLVYIWDPAVQYIPKLYHYPKQFCIDARETDSGTVEYSANICYTHPEEYHQKMCYGHTCIRKCCEHGELMDTSLYRCIAHPNATFNPPFTSQPLSYKNIVGKPLCAPQTKAMNVTIDARGHLHAEERQFDPIQYCTDLFSDGKGNIQNGALVCLSQLTEWDKARNVAFPVCHIISVLFLVLTVVCYCLVPVLLHKGGWYQLFHVLSLIVAYSSTFAQHFGNGWDNPICIAMAIVMQFGYLATFFWLNVLCFEIWRKIRSLSKFQPASEIPLPVYLLYAFGGPLAICIFTLCMQFLAPTDVPSVISPRLAVSRCWFPDTWPTLLYFYGPIAILFAFNIIFITLTYWQYRVFDRNRNVLKSLGVESSEVTAALRVVDHTQRRRDYVADFKQHFSLLVLMAICWVTEVLSWKIPPPVLWALTDILNTLQGFFVFVIFISNRRKRKHLKMKFPRIFKTLKNVSSELKKRFILTDGNGNIFPSLNHLTSQLGRKISSSSIVSNVSTLTTSIRTTSSASSSFHLSSSTSKKIDMNRSESFSDSEDGIIALSHSTLNRSDSGFSDKPC